MGFINPTVDDFKIFFGRDFPYGTDPATSVVNNDISKAFTEVDAVINQGLFGQQSTYQLGYLYLAAHMLVTDLQASSQGISGKYAWNATSKSVGSVSESMQIPERIMANPELAMLTKTNYGAKYLSLILPMISGMMFGVRGRTHA